MERIQLRFGKSSSGNFGSALKLASTFDSFTQPSESQPYFQVEPSSEELHLKTEEFQHLWDLVAGWKSSQLLRNGSQLDRHELGRITTTLNCCSEYRRAIIQESHCLTHGNQKGWSCKLLDTISRYQIINNYHRQKAWYSFGHFEKESIWVIDKPKLESVLRREAELKHLEMCPVFNFDFVSSEIASLPDRIDVSSSDTWEIEYEENVVGSQLERSPKGIVPKGSGERHSSFGSISVSFGSREESSQSTDSVKARHVPKVSFDDIGGIEDIVEVIREVVELPLIRPDLFEHLGIRPHRGILLHGEPGCGKTLIAKAIANEVDAHFISIGGPELLSKWYGQSEENLREVFSEARNYAPSIIFFDEIDSIGSQRSSEETARLESRLVNQLLTLMDGIESYSDVSVLASTNRIELLDEALLRPGRFDYTIKVSRPTKEGCKKIFSIHTRNMPLAPGFQADQFAERLFGLSGAEIAHVAKEGAYNCMRRNLDLEKLLKGQVTRETSFSEFQVSEEDFYQALTSL